MTWSGRIAAAQLAGGLSTVCVSAGRRLGRIASSMTGGERTVDPGSADTSTGVMATDGSSAGTARGSATGAAGSCPPMTAAGRSTRARCAADPLPLPGSVESALAWQAMLRVVAERLWEEHFDMSATKVAEAASRVEQEAI